VHELTGAECDPDVRGTAADGLEEHEIPRLHLISFDLSSFVVLLSRLAREDGPVLREDPLHEPAAIESA
jgi:hypothetical protein